MSDLLSHIRIVLVEPAGARNVGAIARVMKNMGLTQLVLVNPECDYGSDMARHMAVHATDVLEQAIVYPDLATALQGVHWAIATIGRDTERDVASPRSLCPWLLTQIAQQQNSWGAVIFGREDHGLNNEQLKYAQRYLSIPAHPAYVSLNLAQAVGICCYELSQASSDMIASDMIAPMGESESVAELVAELVGKSVAESVSAPSALPIATLDQIEGYFQQLERLLLKIGYLYPHTVSSRMATLREILKRSDPSVQDVAMLRGMIRQFEWALKNPPTDRPRPPTKSD
jgi:tRNA/rRNA methyltransferase